MIVANLLIKWAVNIIALLAVMHTIQGIKADRWQTTVASALVLGMVNTFLRPLIILLTLPLNIFSLGFFTLVINGFLFYLVSKIVEGFSVAGFWNAFWGALLFSIISLFLNLFINTQKSLNAGFYKFHPRHEPRNQDIIDIKGQILDKKNARE